MNGTEIMTGILTELLLAVLAAGLSVAVAMLGRWLARLKERLFASEEAAAVARTCVLAAEQIYGSGDGKKKLEAALSFAETLLREKGLSVSRKQMEVLAEAALAELNDAFRKEARHGLD
ncbi:MAG: hypothetical protein IJC84_01865 [Clostridia bacterium]|nr:hypothetical protein [Clostridia bacterium]